MDDLESASYCLLVFALVTLQNKKYELPWERQTLPQILEMKKELSEGKVTHQELGI